MTKAMLKIFLLAWKLMRLHRHLNPNYVKLLYSSAVMGGGGGGGQPQETFKNLVLWSVFFVKKLKIKNIFKTCNLI